MTLDGISAEAESEIKISTQFYIDQIETARRQNPLGIDLQFPAHIIPVLEIYCDTNKIPFFHVTQNTCSTAQTYLNLKYFEAAR